MTIINHQISISHRDTSVILRTLCCKMFLCMKICMKTQHLVIDEYIREVDFVSNLLLSFFTKILKKGFNFIAKTVTEILCKTKIILIRISNVTEGIKKLRNMITYKNVFFLFISKTLVYTHFTIFSTTRHHIAMHGRICNPTELLGLVGLIRIVRAESS